MADAPQIAAQAAAQTQYLPQPKPQRQGICLCLSGGGYRAALFHLGAVRRLNELGLLGKLAAISSVSGGSIFSAYLSNLIASMTNGAFANYEATVAVPFRKFVKNNIRTAPILSKLLPWEWTNAGAQAEGLQAQYEKLLVPGKKLKDLPTNPRFIFCSTDLPFGVNWIFTRDKVGDYQAGYMDPAISGNIPVAQAVAASSCFPPVFKPMPLSLSPNQLTGGLASGSGRDDCVCNIGLTDGGVYDNMGLEPVWKTCATLLVCDGGKPFRFAKESDTPHQVLRLNDVMGDQAEAVRKRWLMSNFLNGTYTGTYWGIKSAVSDYHLPATSPGYSKPLATDIISTIRTDMDCFSDQECGVLEIHGYLLADAALQIHVPELYTPIPPSNPDPLSKTYPALWPDPASLQAVETQIRKDLADSANFHIFGH